MLQVIDPLEKSLARLLKIHLLEGGQEQKHKRIVKLIVININEDGTKKFSIEYLNLEVLRFPLFDLSLTVIQNRSK